MKDDEFRELSDQVSALHYTLGLLVRHLHVSRSIDADVFIRELHLVADQPDVPAQESLRQVADQLEGSVPAWNRDREVRDLYMPGRDQLQGCAGLS